MTERTLKKISIVGNAGSGKTTVAFALQKKLNLPLYHLDQYCWKPHWEKVDVKKFEQLHYDLCLEDSWIMEGSYYKVLRTRLEHADAVIFLDVPRLRCVWNVIKRAVKYYSQDIPGNPENCKQRFFSRKFLAFLTWVWHFNAKHRKDITQLLNEYSNDREIHVLNSPKMVEEFLENFRVDVH